MTIAGHKVHLTEEERARLARLRSLRRTPRSDPKLRVGQRVADSVAAGMGSWRFIIIQTSLLASALSLQNQRITRVPVADEFDPADRSSGKERRCARGDVRRQGQPASLAHVADPGQV